MIFAAVLGLVVVLRDIVAPVDECFISRHSLTSPSMERIAWIVLLMIASTTNGFSCVTPEEECEDLPFANASSEDFIKTLKASPTSSNIPDALCRIEIFLDYDKDILTCRVHWRSAWK